MTTNRPRSVPKVALSKVHFRLARSGPGGSIQYACTNSAGGDPSTFSVPDSSQHSGRCAISVRPTASSGWPSACQSVPFEIPTPRSNRNVCAMDPLWRAVEVSGYVPGTRQRRVTYVDRTHLVGELLAQFSLSDRLPGAGRGARRGSPGVAAVPGRGTQARLGDHADPQYPRARGSH